MYYLADIGTVVWEWVLYYHLNLVCIFLFYCHPYDFCEIDTYFQNTVVSRRPRALAHITLFLSV